MNSLRAIRTVLVRPTHPGNIGGTARALKNMGLEQFYLVDPADPSSPDAQARAADATDVLSAATVCRDLNQAIADCHFVVGTSARGRRIGWPMLDPTAGAARLLEEAQRGPVALLFGQERTGLTNAELDRCHALCFIPSSPVYPSLNLVGAVHILAYEIYRAAGSAPTAPPGDPPATEEEVENFHAHLRDVLVETDFLDPDNPRLLLRRLRRLFNRAKLDKNEVNILRGILTAVQTTIRSGRKR
jgi:tRNA (cytidine32/uridine32-2'-O)-methyltransferase